MLENRYSRNNTDADSGVKSYSLSTVLVTYSAVI